FFHFFFLTIFLLKNGYANLKLGGSFSNTSNSTEDTRHMNCSSSLSQAANLNPKLVAGSYRPVCCKFIVDNILYIIYCMHLVHSLISHPNNVIYLSVDRHLMI
ncbi:hypothetical protein EGW08_019626, partial [Elysia chlorotica]